MLQGAVSLISLVYMPCGKPPPPKRHGRSLVDGLKQQRRLKARSGLTGSRSDPTRRMPRPAGTRHGSEAFFQGRFITALKRAQSAPSIPAGARKSSQSRRDIRDSLRHNQDDSTELMMRSERSLPWRVSGSFKTRIVGFPASVGNSRKTHCPRHLSGLSEAKTVPYC